MSVSVVITNLSASAIHINELYTNLGAAGSANESVTVQRSVAELDSMNEVKTLLNAGTISVVPTQSADNTDLLSIPLEQHGTVTGVSVNAVAEVVTAVTFPKAFPSAVVPKVYVTVNKSTALLSRSTAYVQAVTNAGFNLALDVTTAQAGQVVSVNWMAVY